MPDFTLELAAGGLVAGVDEAGRGPWAGPVVAGAATLDAASLPDVLRDGLNDSKLLKKDRRESLFAALETDARVGVGIATVDEIDALNILQATFLAMARAVEALGVVPDLALVDGNRPPKLACPAQCVVKGDARCLSIAAASIVAKVTRDRMMAELAAEWPGYGWERNAGYGTAEHKSALEALGVTPHHRKSFAPIAQMLSRG